MYEPGADIVGTNCKFDPWESLKAVGKMKEGLDRAGIKVHFAFQPLGYHCPDAGKNGYTDLAEWPYGTYISRKRIISFYTFFRILCSTIIYLMTWNKQKFACSNLLKQ